MKRVILASSNLADAKRIFKEGVRDVAEFISEGYGPEGVYTDYKTYILWFDDYGRICDPTILAKGIEEDPEYFATLDPADAIQAAAPFIQDPMDQQIMQFANKYGFLDKFAREYLGEDEF